MMAIIDEEIFFFSERSDSDFNSFLDSSNPKQNLFKINNTGIPQSSSANQLVYLSQPTHKNCRKRNHNMKLQSRKIIKMKRK